MLVYRSTIAAAIVAGALLPACADPDLPTDLKKSGPPDVTTVTVMSDLTISADPGLGVLSGFEETATFCTTDKSFVSKRPGLVGTPDFRTFQICPDDPTMAAPDTGAVEAAPSAWFVRIVFDELLDPSVEDLLQVDPSNPMSAIFGTIRNTQPVTLRCQNLAGAMTDVTYDGYYVPNGNRNAFPPGPSLFVQPMSQTSVPTAATCTVSIKDTVHNKAGQSVLADQRGSNGEYKFKLAEMQFRFAAAGGQEVDLGDPAGTDGSLEISPKSGFVDLFWTAQVDPSVTTSAIVITAGPNAADGGPNTAVCDGSAGTPVAPARINVAPRMGAPTVMRIDLSPTHDTKPPLWDPGTTYLVTFGANGKVPAKQGSMPGTPSGTIPADLAICFHTTGP